ncbi:MAG: peptidoglycan DD-metalloendopeptidase family protein [Xanthobacteraceae bacterium]
MTSVAELFRARQSASVAVVALISAGLAGCSADTHRFAENPFATQSRQQEVTGGVAPARAAPVARVESRPLPQYQYQSAPPQTTPAYGYPQANNQRPNYQQPNYQQSGVSGGGRGLASYTPPPARPIETTANTAPRSIASNAKWSVADGTTIIVGSHDTVDTLAQRYGVPSREIMKANGLPTPRNLQPGQQLVIPRQITQSAPVVAAPATVAPSHVASAPRPAPVTAVAAGGGQYVVNPGETLYSIARKNNISPAALAKANNIPITTQLNIGAKINVPGLKRSSVASAAPAQVQAQPPKAAQAVAQAQPKPAAPVVVAAAPVARREAANLASETKEIEKEARQDATGGLPSFRWPVRGRVIAAYGAKTSGKQNDGINVAVPEGTPVKAAEDGVVTYAGNELKGYGNLVLVRHSNGYVTAYAHASELMVKRGETIKRGQTIAKAGQTGEVGSPQLHFEIRQGSTPVDPSKFLNGT